MKDILDFEKKYKGSAEEREDLIQLYVKYEGDMDLISASAMCCTAEDEPRLCQILRAAIKADEVPAFPAFTKESDKKKKARRKRVRVAADMRVHTYKLEVLFAVIVLLIVFVFLGG